MVQALNGVRPDRFILPSLLTEDEAVFLTTGCYEVQVAAPEGFST